MNFTALVVEDDALQRETLADLLKDEGLEVIECTTAEAAELVIASTGAELKALVTDVSLAGEMSGAELVQFAAALPAHQRGHGIGSPAALHSAGRIVSVEAVPTWRASEGGFAINLSSSEYPNWPFPL